MTLNVGGVQITFSLHFSALVWAHIPPAPRPDREAGRPAPMPCAPRG